MPCFIPSKRLRQCLCLLLLTLAISIGGGCLRAIAQTPEPTAIPTPDKAVVAVDGTALFQVSGSGEYTAKERADLINLQLKDAVVSPAAIAVNVEERNQLPTLLLNDRYLLTVTAKDTDPGISPPEQATLWAQELEAKIQAAQAERRPEYLKWAALQAGVVLLGVGVLHWFLGWLRQRGLRRLSQSLQEAAAIDSAELSPTSTSTRYLAQFLKILLAVVRAGLWGVAVLYVTNLFPLTRLWSYQVKNAIAATFTSPLLPLGPNAYSLIDLLLLAFFLVGVVITAGIVTDLLRSRLLTLAGISRGVQEVIAILIKYSFITIGVLVLLQIWGLDLSSLTIVASALGVGVGFGLQDIAKNFGSGLVLVFERPIQVGDFIEIGASMGTVEKIGARSTQIRTLDHVTIIVPNSRFLGEEVINWSHGNPISRLHIPVGVAYSADPKLVKTILRDAAQSHPDVLQEPPPQVLFKGFGDSALNFDLLVWTMVPHRQFLLTSDLYFKIFERLQAQAIEIPFPQRDLHLRSGALALSPETESLLTNLSKLDAPNQAQR